MPKRIDHADGTISIQFRGDEMAELFRVSLADLERWQELVTPVVKGAVTEESVYRFEAQEELRKIRHRIMVLRTGVTVTQLVELEKGGPKILEGLAALAQDAPPGITALIWRTYAIVVYDQLMYGKMLNATELAIRAGDHLKDVDPMSGEVKPSAELAEIHLGLLQYVGALKYSPEGWIHQGLPRCMRTTRSNARAKAN